MYVLYAGNVKGKCFTDTMLVCVGESWNDHNSPWHKTSMHHSLHQIPYNQAFLILKSFSKR